MTEKNHIDSNGTAIRTEVMSEMDEAFERANAMHTMMNGESMLSAADNILSDKGESDDWQLSQVKQPNPSFFSSISSTLGHGWDRFADNVRYYTPAIIVNESARMSFASRAAADALSLVSGLKYSSSPRAMASAISLAGLGLGLVFDEKPMTEEQRDQIKSMPMLDYVGMRLKQGFDPKNHVTATVGLATIPNGLLTIASGISQSRKGYRSPEILQGAMTTAAGLALNLIPNQEKAWQISTGIFLARIPVAYKQADEAFYKGKPQLSGTKGYSLAEKEAHSQKQVMITKTTEREGMFDYLQPKTSMLDTWEHKGNGGVPKRVDANNHMIKRTENWLDEAHAKLENESDKKAIKSLRTKAEGYSGRLERYRTWDPSFDVKVENVDWKEHKGKYYISQEWKAIPGDWQQLGKFWLNQLSNVFGFLYGGVKKDEQGNIVRLQKNEPVMLAETEDRQSQKPKLSVQSPTQLAERLVEPPEQGQSAV